MAMMMMMVDDGYEKAIKKREPKRNYKKNVKQVTNNQRKRNS